MCERCNQIGEVAGEMGFTAGLHNHMGQMVQTPEEVDRFMAMTDPKLFGLVAGYGALHLGGSDVVQMLEKYKHRIRFLDYKDAKRNAPSFKDSIVDLGDGEIDFPGCHRVLKSVNYRGWVCVDLDTARLGPLWRITSAAATMSSANCSPSICKPVRKRPGQLKMP